MNKWNTTSYIGITNDLARRSWEHKQKILRGFTEKYNLDKLVYYENFNNAYDAISREKPLKKWSRRKKLKLISYKNPEMEDLSDKLGW